MASGFGTFNSTTRVSSAGAVVSATIWQEVDTTNRTVTVKLRVTAAYYRQASGSWTPGGGGLIYTSQNNSNYLGGYVGDATNSSTGGTIGLSSVSGVTYSQGLIYNIQEGYVVARSGCYAEAPIISKTYYYNTSGDAITDSWSAELYIPTTGSTRSQLSGTFTTDSIGATTTPPSGLAVEWKSHTWNSVTGKVTLSSYGIPSSETNRYIELGVCSSSNTDYGAPYRFVTAPRSTNSTMTVQANSYGALTLKGATSYKLGAWASNTQLSTKTLQSTVRYTPPAPLQGITKTETQGINYVSTVFTVTGGTSTNNTSATVATEIRISTNGGSTWGAWTEIGTGTAWTAKTYTANIPYGGVSVKVQARQRYYGQYSEVKELSYTSAAAVPPENPAVSVNSTTWNSASLSGSIDSYGRPGSLSGRKLNIGLADGDTGSPAGMEVQTANATSATVTVNNNSIAVRGGFTLKGMMTVYPYTYANNTVVNNIVYGSAVTLPPAPGQITYSVDPDNASTYIVSFAGDITKNIMTYTPIRLTRTIRYADSNDPTNWTYIENDTNAPVDFVTTQNVTVPAGHTIIVEAWMTYMSVQSEVTTLSITNSSDPVRLYGAARKEDPDNPGTLLDPTAEEIEHLYGSVNGTAKKLDKLYASVNGVAKLIFEDL